MSQAENEKPQTIRRVFKGEVDDVSKTKRTVTSIITTDRVDHYREVISAKGIQLDVFRENPIVLWCHMGTCPIGKNLWLKRFTKDGMSGIIAKTLFAKTDKAEEIFQLYVDEILNGWSIGANPDWTTCGPPNEDEIKARPDWKKCRSVYRKSTLVEYSACSIPANPDALGNETERHISAELRRAIESSGTWRDIYDDEPGPEPAEKQKEPALPPLPPKIELPALVGRTFAEELHRTRAMVARMTGPEAAKAAAVEQLDRLKGKV